MTDKEKLIKIKKLADAMYYGAFNMTTDASLLKKAMKEYCQFTIHEYCKEEPVSIWHSIEELPTAREYEYILVIYKDTTSPRVAGNKTQVLYWDRVDKWAYLNDVLKLSNVERTVKDWKEPVNKFLNTESMIESHKQKLISQVNNMKNSPFVNMCLDSYKQGISEILDTLNLSNAQTIDATIGYWNHSGLSIDVKLPKDLKEGSKCKILIIKDK